MGLSSIAKVGTGALLILVVLPATIILVLTLIRCQQYPEKSFKNNLYNVLLAPLRIFRIGPYKGKISIENSMKYAVKKAKLTDFGDTRFIDAYKVIEKSSIHKKLRLSNLGYISHSLEMNETMVRRLKMVEYLKKHPEVLRVPVREPVFVVGLPRTGTTFLHRLLSLDPAVRSPYLWELLAFVPTKDGERDMAADNQKRANGIRKLLQLRRDMGDTAIDHIHETSADLPEECIWAMSDELPLHMSFLYTIYCDYDYFINGVTVEQRSRAYDYYKQVLQLLSYCQGEAGSANNSKEPRRWMLKSPMHMFMIPQIAHAFPDAKIILTHRHPVSAVPSMCSLVKSLHQLYYENESRDDRLIGKEIARISGDLLADCNKQIAEAGFEHADSVYEDLIKDPIQAIRKIYQTFNWPFTVEYEKILREFLEDDSKKRESQKKNRNADKLHSYTPEEFGLTAETLSSGLFKEYIDRYNIPMSRG
jgi:hypothetical protein